MTRLAALALLCLAPCACELSVYSGAGVGVSTAGSSPDVALPGWSLQGRGQASYAAEVDTSVVREGRATVRVHPTGDPGGQYATFMTTLDAAPLRGRRAHAVVWVRTQGVTGRGDAWMRAQGADAPADGPGLAMSMVRLAPNADFTRYELTVDVPDDAASVQLGIGLGGPGMFWLDAVKVEAL